MSSSSPPIFAFFNLSFTFNRLSKWLAAAILAAVIVWRRHDGKGMWAGTGSLVNVGISIALKNMINQPRPFPPKRQDPGMPSAHAQILFYTFTFLVSSLMEWLGTNRLSLLLAAAALCFGSYLSWLRVSRKYHTPTQVLVGASLGATFSLLWHWAWTVAILEAFESILWVRVLVFLGAGAFWLVFGSISCSKCWKTED